MVALILRLSLKRVQKRTIKPLILLKKRYTHQTQNLARFTSHVGSSPTSGIKGFFREAFFIRKIAGHRKSSIAFFCRKVKRYVKKYSLTSKIADFQGSKSVLTLFAFIPNIGALIGSAAS